MTAPRRTRRTHQTRLRRSVEEAMRQRLSGRSDSGHAAGNGELFPDELDQAIDQALSQLGTPPTPVTGG